MARDQLERYRDAVDDDARGPELGKLLAKVQKAGLEVWGESLATAPRGYPKDHKRIELLRRKSLALGAALKLRARHRPRRRAPVRHQDMAHGRARDRLAGP